MKFYQHTLITKLITNKNSFNVLNIKTLFHSSAPIKNKSTQNTHAKSANFTKRKLSTLLKRVCLFGGIPAVLGGYLLLRPFTEMEVDFDDFPKDNHNDYNTYKRAEYRLSKLRKFLFEPASNKLLEKQQEPPKGTNPLITLVVNLDETLIKITWDKEYGYRAALRPGLEKFLGLMASMYEVVLFSSLAKMNAEPIVIKLDPYGMYFHHHLFREETRYVNKRVVKDLSYLNRDLKRVIVMDSDPDAYYLNKENALFVPAWNGDPKDTYLTDVLPILETIAINNEPDIPKFIGQFKTNDIPKEFKGYEEEQRQALIQKSKGGLRQMLSGITNTRPTLDIELKRSMLENNYEKHKDEMRKMAKEHYDKAMEENKKMMQEKKFTPWKLFKENVIEKDQNKN